MAYNNKVIGDFVFKLFTGMGVGAFADFLVEILRVPILNDTGTFINSTMSNFELGAYALSTGGTVAGVAAVGSGSNVGGFTSELLPYFLGFGIGVQQYETWVAEKLGIRGIDPYQTIQSAIPQIPIF